MAPPTPYYKTYLREELTRRCRTNSNYSMRSFARALKIDPAVLSRILGDKRALSLKVADRVTNNLCMSPKEKRIFLESVAEDQKQRGLRNSVETFDSSSDVSKIDNDIFHIIGDWYHYAIQQLTQTIQFRSDPRWIAKRLGITVLETKLAIQRLLSVGLIELKDGIYKAKSASIDTADKSVSTPALRKYQRQLLQKAIFSLENDPIDQRSMTSMTMPIDKDKIPLAKKLIEEFSNDLSEVMGSSKKNALYQLSVQFFPLEKLDS